MNNLRRILAATVTLAAALAAALCAAFTISRGESSAGLDAGMVARPRRYRGIS
jgi:hypothetical protein